MPRLVTIARRLADECDALRFAAPVAYVYNPLTYARRAHEAYLERHAHPGVDTLLVGMNPGPFGMAQTGVPFGEVSMVRDWLGIDAPVDKPPREHPKRPVLGFACPRREVSGARLWGWARDRFQTPDAFFARFFVWNWCPLAFMDANGRNLTPDKLPAAERIALEAACDRALRDVTTALHPRRAIGVGAFATKCLRRALDGRAIEIETILHPSPASPAANRGWAEQVDGVLMR